MRYRALVLLLTAQILPAGQFRHGFAGARGDVVKLRVPKPPVFFIGKKQISVEVLLAAPGVQGGGLGSGTLSGVGGATPWQPPGTQQLQQQAGGGYGAQPQLQQSGGGYGSQQQQQSGTASQQQQQAGAGGGYGGGYGSTSPQPTITGGYGGGYGSTTGSADPYGQAAAQARILSEFAAPDLAAIRIAAEQILSPEFAIVQQAPERMVRIHVVAFDPVRTQQTVMQQVVQDQAGQQAQVPVDVWEGVGRLSLRVEIVDPSTSRVLDGFAPSAEFRKRGAIAVAGQQRVDPATLPIAEGIWKGLVADSTAPLRERYMTTAEAVEFNLAVDEELRPGNELAKNNYWKEALEKWQSASIRKAENQGDKLFNIGAAHEALAYEAMAGAGAAAAKPHFEKALQHYNEAARLDPKEKYITSATDRLKKTAEYLNRGIRHHNATLASVQQEQQAQQQLAAQRAAEQQARAEADKARQAAETAARAAEEAKVREFSTPRADTVSEASFRKLVKVRLRAMNAVASPEDQAKLQAMGAPVYKLQPVEAERVVWQESAKWTELLPKIAQYKETYAALFADKRIASDEREVLKQLAAALGLATDEASAVEAQFQ